MYRKCPKKASKDATRKIPSQKDPDGWGFSKRGGGTYIVQNFRNRVQYIDIHYFNIVQNVCEFKFRL